MTTRDRLEKHEVQVLSTKRTVTKLEYRFRNDSRYIGDWELAKPTGKGVMIYIPGYLLLLSFSYHSSFYHSLIG